MNRYFVTAAFIYRFRYILTTGVITFRQFFTSLNYLKQQKKISTSANGGHLNAHLRLILNVNHI